MEYNKIRLDYDLIECIKGEYQPRRSFHVETDLICGREILLPPYDIPVRVVNDSYGQPALLSPDGADLYRPETRQRPFDFVFRTGEHYAELAGRMRLCLRMADVLYIQEGTVHLRQKGHGIRRMVLPSGITAVDDDAFYYDTDIEEVVLPEGVTRIGQGAFSDCLSLRELGLPATLCEIGAGAFERCAFREFSWPSSLKDMGDAMFRRSSLVCMVLPQGLVSVGESAFEGCRELKAVYIPDSVVTVGRDAFAGCPSLTIYCEGAIRAGWCEREGKISVAEQYTTPEDDAFNFHRSGGGFTSHTVIHEEEAHLSWNPEGRPVYTGISRAKFREVLAEICP